MRYRALKDHILRKIQSFKNINFKNFSPKTFGKTIVTALSFHVFHIRYISIFLDYNMYEQVRNSAKINHPISDFGLIVKLY